MIYSNRNKTKERCFLLEYSGFAIRKERLEKNWSQEGICRGICAVSYLSKIEQGKTEASGEIITALFERLGIEWISDKEVLLQGEKFVEDWYEAAFSSDWDEYLYLSEKFDKEYAFLENSCFGIDVMILKNFGGEEVRKVDERLEVCMDSRQLALQKLFGGDFSAAIKLYPCSYMFYRAGVSDYEKGNNSAALENLQKAYDLASQEGRARIMMLAKFFITNCYSNMCDMDSMERHGKIAKRLARELGENGFAETYDYNFAATKIETGDYSGAYDYFSKLTEPSAPSLHKLAVCCEKLGKREEAFAAIEKEKNAKAEDAIFKIFADEACELIKFRLLNEDYLSNPDYGKMLLDFFELCRKKMPIGYAKFHLPWVLEWYTANRQYKQAFEFLNNFPEK